MSHIYDDINNNINTVVYISSETCGACDAVYPKLDILLKTYKNIHLVKVDMNECKDVLGQWMVFTVPSILVFYDGKEIHRESRFIQFDRLKHHLDLIVGVS